MRLFLLADTTLGEEGLLSLLGAYGMSGRTLGHQPLPLPFARGHAQWNRLVDETGQRWALVQSRLHQPGMLHPRALHRLFALDFPLWGALDIGTYTAQETTRLLRTKDAAARFERSESSEAQAVAQEVRGAVGKLRQELAHVGAALHTVRFSALVSADSENDLHERLEMVRASSGLEMESWERRATEIPTLFTASPPPAVEGSLLPSHGVALLAGSALSYRRRTETRGVYLGADRNQAPVVLNLFDERHSSYSSVILGQPGSGKSFFALLLMLRHLLMGVQLIIVDPQGNIDLSWLGEEVAHKSVLGTSEASINVLDIAHDELGAQVATVIAMLGLLGVVDRTDRTEVALLDQVLVDIYAPLWGRVAPTQVPTLRAVQERLELIAGDEEQSPTVRDRAALLALALDPYTGGSRTALFGRRTSVDFRLEHAVTVFDVSRLPKDSQDDNLRAALLSILVGDINQAIRRKRRAGDTTPILMFIDEMGILMRDPVIAAHVSEEFKTARSRHVGMITADQDLHSYLGPADASGLHHGVAMLANSASVFLFHQRASELGRVREHFPDLPAALIDALPLLPQGVCIAQLPDDLLQLQVQASAFEQTVLSSRLPDRERARDLMQHIRSDLQGVSL